MNFLDSIELLDTLTLDEKAELSNFCQERIIPKWEVLFSEGDDANAMYILKKWSVNIYKNIDGHQVFLWAVQAQEILWEMALFQNDGKRMATWTAADDTTIITLLSFSIKTLANKNPLMMQKIQKIIDDRVNRNSQTEAKFRGI